ncbi:hypothetical protein ACS0TY_023159 [Phlomoides rotata]
MLQTISKKIDFLTWEEERRWRCSVHGVMNNFINDIFEKLAQEAACLARYNKKPTISSLEIQTAVRLVLSGELAEHVISEGTNVVIKFTIS